MCCFFSATARMIWKMCVCCTPGCIFCKWPGIVTGAATCPPGAQPNWAAKRCFIPTATPFHVKFGLAELEQAAREAHADICLFGHTHQQMTDYRDGLYLMNPGAAAEGRYGMVDITPGGIMLLPCRL